jgi:hypothetical protein
MTRYGYFQSCEQYDPAELARQAGLVLPRLREV